MIVKSIVTHSNYNPNCNITKPYYHLKDKDFAALITEHK